MDDKWIRGKQKHLNELNAVATQPPPLLYNNPLHLHSPPYKISLTIVNPNFSIYQMPKNGMRSVYFHPKTPARTSTSATTPPRTNSAMEKIIDSAELLITKWDPDSTTYTRVTSLFYESKREAMQFIESVTDLQTTMHTLVISEANSEKLVRAQRLMQIAMKRLQKELYQILSMNRAQLDPESISARSSTSDYTYDEGDEILRAGESIAEVEEASSAAMADLKLIADCMIASGYAKECIAIYKIIRKSIIDEGVYRLGVEKLSSSRIKNMDWEVLELKINSWLEAVKISMRTLFTGERILCDHVFAASDAIRESCFTAISGEGANLLFGFPEIVAKARKSPSPEKIFRLLDMYTAISDNWMLIDSIFSFESTSAIRSQALNSLALIGESVRVLLTDFETGIQKDSSKSPVYGCGVHPLTVHAMNYLAVIADYSGIVADIFSDWTNPAMSYSPEPYFDSPTPDEAPPISLRIARIILVLLCKLDSKAKLYGDVSLSYLFLANNFCHVVHKVRTSNLQYLLGEEWISRHDTKVRRFAASYEQLAWGKVLLSLPENPAAALSPADVKNHFLKFNSTFEEAYRSQSSSVASDEKLREEIKNSIEKNVVRAYTLFYTNHRVTVGLGVAVIVRYAPEDIRNYLSDLLAGTGDQGTASSEFSSSSSHSRWWRGRVCLRRTELL